VYGGKALFPQWLYTVRLTDTTYAHSSTGNPES